MWWAPSKSKDIKPLPWLHYDAIRYLADILNEDMQIVEFGGGGSTLWFSALVDNVITYEPNPEWYMTLATYDLPNVLFRADGVWNSKDFCDLLFIDGEPIELRSEWLKKAHLISNTWIVLDNANRPEYAKDREALKEYAELIHTVNGNEGGTKYLVTEFWKLNRKAYTMEYKICNDCEIKHYTNCNTCFGFGVYRLKNRPNEIFPVSANEAMKTESFLGDLEICPECGSSKKGIPL